MAYIRGFSSPNVVLPAVCCSVCGSVVQCVAVRCSVLQCVAVCGYPSWHISDDLAAQMMFCLQYNAVCGSVVQCVAVCCCVLQCVAVCCSVLQCVAVPNANTRVCF